MAHTDPPNSLDQSEGEICSDATECDLLNSKLTTPFLVVDKLKLMQNVGRIKERLNGTGAVIRPHLKTVKSHAAALLVMDSPAGPAAVSTLLEAEEFGRQGVTDLLYAVGMAPQKLDRVSKIRAGGVDLQIVVDNLDAAIAVAAHARRVGDRIPVLIEIDVDDHRAGISVGDKGLLLSVARALHEGAELRGVMTHAGESYNESTPEGLLRAAEQERSGAVQMAECLRQGGFECPVVSIGSTPTAFAGGELDGVTEVRAGVFTFFDLVQAGIGVCSIDDIAMSVVATVIGHQNKKGWIITDAGWMALSSDRGTASQKINQYAGLVCDIHGKPYPDWVVLNTNQEQGILAARPGSSAAPLDLPVGARVRILPNHACATASQHARYQLVENSLKVVGAWERFGGW